jgi:hypothetical protein
MRVWWKKKKIVINIEKDLDDHVFKDWDDSKNWWVRSFKDGIIDDVKSHIRHNIDYQLGEELEGEIKDLVAEILSSDEFKGGMKGVVREHLESKFRKYLEGTSNEYR